MAYARQAQSVLHAFVHDDDAATAAEYGILACMIALAIVASARALGISLAHPFTTVSSALGR